MLKKIFFYLPAFIFLIPIIFFKSELTILPGKNYKIIPYNDVSDHSGNSTVKITYNTDDSIIFDFNLRETEPANGKDPYAGFAIDLAANDNFIDISSYKYLCVDMIAKQSASYNIQLKTFIDGFTVLDNFRTYHIETCQVPVHIGNRHYIIPLEKFTIPDWWYKEVGKTSLNLPRLPDYSKLFGINFQSGSNSTINLPDRFIITRISFVKERGRLIGICAALFVLYIITVFIVRLSLQKKIRLQNNSPVIEYRQLDISSHSDEEVKRLVNYIGAHFQDPDLSVETVGRETGINQNKVPAILQHKFNMAFKQYLNEIRITEAKRLLKDTDRTITEIAFSVGYNNVTHFNRVFRQDVGIAPSTYRESNKTGILP
jgi:AraC-like DNA-binding protein